MSYYIESYLRKHDDILVDKNNVFFTLDFLWFDLKSFTYVKSNKVLHKCMLGVGCKWV